jgi:lysophospholipase L1-like esterase
MRRLAAVLAFLLALLVAAPAPAHAAPPVYVALGDSYAAGPIIPVPVKPWGCLKSSNNYANHVAADLGYTLRDATCSGAETGDMTNPQGVSPDGPNPPQFDRLDANVAMVTLQIGGNDIGFTSILENCATANPFAHPCRDKYVVNGHDTLADKIAATAPKVAAVLQGIHARSPSARVFVVNYAAILPETGSGCWPQVPIAFSDVSYLRGVEKNLNAMLAQQATADGARIVDDYTASIGRDACRSSSTRWVEPLVPTNAAAPFHPNARGEAGIATVVAGAVSG